MKRTHLLIALLLTFIAVPLFAVGRSNVVDDVIRMQKAGVAEDEIIAFVHKGQSRFDVSADDMIALHDAGVPRAVIKAILDEADARGERRDDYRRDDSRGDGYAPSRLYVYGGYPYYGAPYYGAPYYYDPFYYDPWYYGPRLSIGFGFGFGGFYGHHGGFRHRHW